ncbi:hypothetical protein CF386_12350 [Paraphotobacterium marinum]|uniref:Outer membrane protein beta-barrel domain-containing protein n=1 Tax=Paraphotobacterium marinum TaxID=1755811 RepID=A0A220VIP8_9GAMM|nr:outer membrane beta-barrel protein [Paraphotobacterium marinum]ASK79823.1 hypothetical protein CF386_12350 [Paraphotobacterium marinum]
MKKTLLGIALCTGMAGVAYADPVPYIGAQVGYSFTDLPDADITTAAGQSYGFNKKDDDGFVGEINGGVLFPITDYFLLGPEIGIGMFGYSPKYSLNALGINASVKYENDYYIPLVARAQFPINDDFYLFAKAGVAYVNGETKENIQGKSFKQNQDAWKFTGSLGAGFNLTEQFSLEATYTYIDGDTSGKDIGNDFDDGDLVLQTNNIFVGVNYKF